MVNPNKIIAVYIQFFFDKPKKKQLSAAVRIKTPKVDSIPTLLIAICHGLKAKKNIERMPIVTFLNNNVERENTRRIVKDPAIAEGRRTANSFR